MRHFNDPQKRRARAIAAPLNRIPATLARHFGDDVHFFKTWIDKPKTLGALLPTSSVTSARMASVIDENTDQPVLELGPGSGPVTKAILERGVKPENLYSVEFAEEFLPGLRRKFPGVNFIQGDAFNLNETLPEAVRDATFNAIISALPLLNFPVPQRVAYLNDLLDRVPLGRPVVQISYGPKSPVPPDWKTYTVEPLEWVMRNVPPARLWVYRRIQAN